MAYGLLFSAFLLLVAPDARAAGRPTADSVIEAFSGTPKELIEKMNREVWENNQDIFSDLTRANSYRETELLTSRLLDGSSAGTRLALLENLEANRANYANFIFALRKKLSRDPQALARMNASLMQVKATLKAKKIPFPTPDRCVTWVLTYLGVRSFLFSLRGTWGANEDELVNASFQPVAENGTRLAMLGAGLTCLSEFVLRRNELPRAIRAWRAKSATTRMLDDLAGVVDDLRKNPELLEKSRELKALSQLGEMSKALLIAKQAENATEIRTAKVTRETASPLFLEELRRTYAGEGRMRKVMEEYFDSLSPETVAVLDQSWKGNPAAPGEFASREAVRLQSMVRNDFRDWIATRGKSGETELVDELLRQETEVLPALEEKARARTLTAKVCMGMLAGGLALYGHMASIGNEPTNIDRPEDKLLRKYHSEIWNGLAIAGTSACFLHVGLGPFTNLRLRKLAKNRIFYMNESDWASLRKTALEAKDPKVNQTKALIRLRTLYGKETILAEDIVNRAVRRTTTDLSPPRKALGKTCNVFFHALENTLASVSDAPRRGGPP